MNRKIPLKYRTKYNSKYNSYELRDRYVEARSPYENEDTPTELNLWIVILGTIIFGIVFGLAIVGIITP